MTLPFVPGSVVLQAASPCSGSSMIKNSLSGRCAMVSTPWPGSRSRVLHLTLFRIRPVVLDAHLERESSALAGASRPSPLQEWQAIPRAVSAIRTARLGEPTQIFDSIGTRRRELGWIPLWGSFPSRACQRLSQQCVTPASESGIAPCFAVVDAAAWADNQKLI